MVRQAERKRQTRETLLQAARRLFDRDGYEATSIDAIVAEADVAKGTFYQHFDGKIAVVLALAHDDLAQAAPRVLADLARGRDPIALLTDHLREQCAWFARHRALVVPLIEYGMRFAALPPPPDPAASSRGMFEAYLAQAQAQGLIRRDYPAAELAAVLSGVSSQVLYVWAARPQGADLWPLMERACRLFLEGARPRSAPGGPGGPGGTTGSRRTPRRPRPPRGPR